MVRELAVQILAEVEDHCQGNDGGIWVVDVGNLFRIFNGWLECIERFSRRQPVTETLSEWNRYHCLGHVVCTSFVVYFDGCFCDHRNTCRHFEADWEDRGKGWSSISTCSVHLCCFFPTNCFEWYLVLPTRNWFVRQLKRRGMEKGVVTSEMWCWLLVALGVTWFNPKFEGNFDSSFVMQKWSTCWKFEKCRMTQRKLPKPSLLLDGPLSWECTTAEDILEAFDDEDAKELSKHARCQSQIVTPYHPEP